MRKNILILLLVKLLASVCAGQSPTFEWISPKNDATYEHFDNKLTIKLKVSPPPRGTHFDIEINGRSTHENTKSNTVPLPGGGNFEDEIHIPDNSLQSIVLTIKDGGKKVLHRSKPLIVQRGEIPPPVLYLLSFGPEPPNIKYTIEDALDFAQAFSRQACGTSGLYAQVISDKLTRGEATASAMLGKIGGVIRGNAIKPNDVFILFISSHGYRSEGELRIQGSDYKGGSKDQSDKASVSLSEIFREFDILCAKKIFFIDACKSGNNNDKIFPSQPDDFDKTGYTMISSSGFDASSYWHNKWKNGAFTEALLEGFKGKANRKDINGELDDVITINEILKYIQKKIPEICNKDVVGYAQKEQQIPEIYLNELGDIPIFKYDKFCAPLIRSNDEFDKDFYETIEIPQGKVTIGSIEKEKGDNKDEERRVVRISEKIAIGKYEVTNKAYCEFLNDETTNLNNLKKWIDVNCPSCTIERKGEEFSPKASQADKPVVMVSWYGAVEFAKWLSKKDCIYNYDLPTADQWEYAARYGVPYETYVSTSRFKDFNQVNKTLLVGSYKPSKLDIHDMTTNVSEWCKNWYKEKGKPQGGKEVRGGSFMFSARRSRTAKRHAIYPYMKKDDLGFRLVRTPKKDKDCE